MQEWLLEEGLIKESDLIFRPFWPGKDYQQEEYPEGCVVVDNPPFSIFAKIVDWYVERGIRFFLFAPNMTSIRKNATYVGVSASVTYENGAVVGTVQGQVPGTGAGGVSGQVNELTSSLLIDNDMFSRYLILEVVGGSQCFHHILHRLCVAGEAGIEMQVALLRVGDGDFHAIAAL